MKELDPIREKKLITRLRQGDYEAFDALYVHYSLPIAYYLRQLLKLPDKAEEIHQDVFLKIWERRTSLKPDTPFRPFLFLIAKNAVMDFFRKVARDKQLEQALATHLSATSYDQVADFIDFRETNDAIKAAIAKLPPQRQRIFILCKLEGKSYEDVAGHLGISLSTVKDHMAKAMRFIKTELAQHTPSTLLFLIYTSIISQQF